MGRVFGRHASPDQDIRTKVGAVRPDDGSALDMYGSEQGLVLTDRLNNRPMKKRRNISLDNLAICQGQTQPPSLQGFGPTDAYQVYPFSTHFPLFDWHLDLSELSVFASSSLSQHAGV